MWPFKKKPQPKAPPTDRRVWNEDWQIGDIAECITERWHKDLPPWECPRIGSRYTVTGFSEGIDPRFNAMGYFLRFSELPRDWGTQGFRKVRPVAQEESEVAKRILKAPKVGPDRVREDAE